MSEEILLFVGCKVKDYQSAELSRIVSGLKSCGLVELSTDYDNRTFTSVKYLPSEKADLGRRKIKNIRWDVPIVVFLKRCNKAFVIPKCSVLRASDEGFDFEINKPQRLSMMIIISDVKLEEL